MDGKTNETESVLPSYSARVVPRAGMLCAAGTCFPNHEALVRYVSSCVYPAHMTARRNYSPGVRTPARTPARQGEELTGIRAQTSGEPTRGDSRGFRPTTHRDAPCSYICSLCGACHDDQDQRVLHFPQVCQAYLESLIHPSCHSGGGTSADRTCNVPGALCKRIVTS